MFKRTNGVNLAPNAEGQRIISIAPNVTAVRLRVENPEANQSTIELVNRSGNPGVEYVEH